MNTKRVFITSARISLVIMFLCSFGFLCDSDARPQFGTDSNAVITLKADNYDAMDNQTKIIENLGVRIYHRFPPKVIIGYIPPEKHNAVTALNFIDKVNYSHILYNPNTIDKMSGAGYHFWNNYFINPIVPEHDVPPYPPPNDTKYNTYKGKQTETAGPNGKGIWDTSEFFLGNIIVSVIFPESNGSQENWTTSQFNYATTQIAAGLDWLIQRMKESETGTPISTSMFITFTYVNYEVTPTDVEPIDQPTSNHLAAGNFVDDAMVALGYNAGSPLGKVNTYVNDLIDNTNGIDWGYAIFVVNDENDSDHMFPDGGFAYAYLGGPLVMMTYNNDGYGPSNMPAVAAHESCHIFYALDEYENSPGIGPNPCDDYSGYLNIQNANSLLGPASGGTCNQYMGCIMRGDVPPYYSNLMCKYTKWAMGWKDSDASGVFDVLDFAPDNEFTNVPPDPTNDPTPTFQGRAYIDLEDPPPYDVLPNLNPFFNGFGNHQDLTTNIITKVEYSYQVGVWVPCAPDDGNFNEVEEFWSVTVSPPLPSGTYSFTFRTWNSAGLYYDKYYIFTVSGSGTPTATPLEDFAAPEIDTPYPPCESLYYGPCNPDYPKIQPNPGVNTSRTVIIGCVIRDETAVDASTIQYRIDINGDNDYNDLPDENWRTWDKYFAPHPDEQIIQCKAEVTFLVDKFGLHFEWRALDIFGEEKNGWAYSGKYGYKGIMDDWVVNIDSTPPSFVSANALDTSNQGLGIQTGDTVTIVFNGSTNAFAINSMNIDSVLPLSSSHSWLDSSFNLLDADWEQTSVPNDTLIITLQSTGLYPPTVAPGDTIYTNEASITDIYGNPVVSSIQIKGSFADPMGPDTIYIKVNNQEYEASVPYGTPEIQVTALFSDQGRGNNPIAAAEYFLDDSSIPAGSGFPMLPVDGFFDQDIELVRASIYVPSSWTKDSAHTIYARGQDSAGNWGELHTEKAVTLFYGEYGPDCLIPPEFTGVKTAEQSPTECGGILLTWDKAVDPNNETFYYNIYIAEQSGLENFYSEEGPDVRVSGIDQTQYLVNQSDLATFDYKLGKKFYFVVRAEDACGNEELNIEELSAVPRDNSKPIFEGAKEADDKISCKTVKITWNEGTDQNLDCMAMEGKLKYLVFKANIPSAFDFNNPFTTTYDPGGIFLNNMNVGVVHYFMVRAEDQAGDYGDEPHTITGVTNITMTDKFADWQVDSFKDCYLYPNIKRSYKYQIVSNTTTTIYVVSGSQMVTPYGAKVGDTYLIDCKGNQDDNESVVYATPTWNSFDADNDSIPEEDEIPPFITDKDPPNGSDTDMGYLDHVSFKILDNCSGVDKASIKLWIDYVNVTLKLLITPITYDDKGVLVGGYQVDYYPLDNKLYNLEGKFQIEVKARDYYGNEIDDTD
ncbi:hypothetical protein KKB18_04445, partial [bacterium]|nr:hypothetical protein [bacterium]